MISLLPLHHVKTVIFVHGLGSNAQSVTEHWLYLFDRSTTKLIFLQAPVRYVTCYGQRMRSWHDYYTDNSECNEEDMRNETDLANTRDYIHGIIEKERVSPDCIFLWGQSQGACCALDAALSFKQKIGGIFMSFGMLYSTTIQLSTPPIYAFHGENDTIIPYKLFKKSMKNIQYVEGTASVEHTVWTLQEEAFLRKFIRKFIMTASHARVSE